MFLRSISPWSTLAIGSLLLVPVDAKAHKVGLEAKLIGSNVRVEAYYDDDTPADGAKVTVTTEDGRLLAQGTTDAKGFYFFPIPAAGSYRIDLDAGDGHAAKTTITIRPPSPSGSSPNDGTSSEAISDGPSRSEFTATPWGRLLIGLGILAVLTISGRLLARRHRADSTQ